MPRPAAALCLALLAGCSRPDLVPAEPEAYWQLVVEVEQYRGQRVDILFVIDTSPSMVEEAAVVPLRVSEMVRVLLDPPSPDSGPEPPRLRDLHVGVVTADPADGGVLQPGGTWLTQERDLMDERCEPIVRPLWEDVLRMADLGASGSSISRPLEAAVRALTVQAEPGAPNDGFLREDSSLFVVVVTDGDDASPGTLERYHDELLALRPSLPVLVSVAVVAGIPTDGSWGPGDSIEALRELDRDLGCEADHARASLPPRLAELTYLLGRNGMLWSVCQDDWSPVAGVLRMRHPPEFAICPPRALSISEVEDCRMVGRALGDLRPDPGLGLPGPGRVGAAPLSERGLVRPGLGSRDLVIAANGDVHISTLEASVPRTRSGWRARGLRRRVWAMVRYTGVNHLAMATGDMDRTVRFWRDLLGLRLVAGLGSAGSRHYFFELSDRDMIAFFEWPGVEAYSFDPNGIAIEVSWAVEGRDVRRQPVLIDPAPPSAAAEGPEPRPERWPAVAAPTPPEDRRVHPGAGADLFDGRKKNLWAERARRGRT